MKPRVSVIIPAYNSASFIEETLSSVAAQTYRDFETIVVDDGSGDGTYEVATKCLKDFNLSGRCLRQKNKKIAAARNAGIREAGGEFVSFLDADDVWYPEKLEIVMREFDAHPEADLVCHDENMVEKGRFLRVFKNGPWKENMYPRLLFKGNALSTSGVTVRRQKVLLVGGFRENPEFNTVEDYDLWMRLSQVCRFHFIDRILGEYRYDERGSSRRIVYHHENLESLLRDHFKSFCGETPRGLDHLRVRRRLAACYRSALGLLMTYSESPEMQRHYALKMLRVFPLDPKNAVRALQWVGRKLWRR